MEQITAARASSNPDEILKIARQLADELITAPRASGRVTAFVLGLFRKAEALQAESITADDMRRMGRMYLMLSESYADVASGYLERAVLRSGEPEDRVAWGNALMYIGDVGAARREYMKVAELRPDDPVIQVNLSMTDRVMGDTAGAYRRLRQVLQKPGQIAAERAAMLAIADIQAASNDRVGARLQVQKILQKWPTDADAQAMLKKIQANEPGGSGAAKKAAATKAAPRRR